MKFKNGERARVIKNLSDWDRPYIFVTEDMLALAGKEVTVEVAGDAVYFVNGSDAVYWHKDMLEKIEQEDGE